MRFYFHFFVQTAISRSWYTLFQSHRHLKVCVAFMLVLLMFKSLPEMKRLWTLNF